MHAIAGTKCDDATEGGREHGADRNEQSHSASLVLNENDCQYLLGKSGPGDLRLRLQMPGDAQNAAND
jgi:hypothetical protein